MNGGIIGVANIPTKTTASGVWTLEEQFLARVQDIWPTGVPSVVTNASVWLDASDLSTITEASGSVSQWDNKGTLGNFTQGTGALQPTTGATTQNGLNVIDFAADFLVSADAASAFKFMTDGTDHLICAVWKPGTTADPNAAYTLLATNITSSVVGMFVFYDDRVSTPADNKLVHSVSPGSFTQNVANVSADGFLTPNTFSVTTVFADPNNGTAANRSELYTNAGTATKNNSSTTAVSGSNPANTLRVGDGTDAGFTLTGSIAEIVIVSGANATEANRVIIRDYLNSKWDVY